ncbi:MAG: hypothetical protein QW734_09065 [Candidatus Bathyarchaeia archaeon]
MKEIIAMKKTSYDFDTSPVITLRDYREFVIVLFVEPWDSVTVNCYVETFNTYQNEWYTIATGSSTGGYKIIGPLWAPEVVRIRVAPTVPGQQFHWGATIYAY